MDTKEWARWWRQLGQTQLRAVLMEEWDPAGVAVHIEETDEEFAPWDEYDSYMSGIVALLRVGADTERLATHLSSIVSGSMGMPSTPLQEARAAKAILRWWAESPHPT